MADEETVSVSGWGATLRASGVHAVALISLFIGLAALIGANWYGFRTMHDEFKNTAIVMSEVSKRRDAQSAEAKVDHADILKAIEAATWVLAQDDATKRALRLPEPPGIRDMRRRYDRDRDR